MDADRTPSDPGRPEPRATDPDHLDDAPAGSGGAGPWSTGRRRATPAGSGARPHGSGGDDPWQHWRRLRPRTVRGATALGIVGAAVLLFPLLDDPDRWWVPVGLGFGTLVLLALLRLDRLLNGWAPHVAGLVLVAALVQGTSRNPWAWGLALAVGVIVAGLLLLPRWKVLAVGAVLLVLSGIGYTFRSAEIEAEQARIDAQAGAQVRAELGVDRPLRALVSLDSGVVDNNPAQVCQLLQPAATAQLTSVIGSATCEEAVATLHTRVPAGAEVTRPARRPDPKIPPGETATLDACGSAWGAAAGPGVGKVVLARTLATSPTYQVSSFAPC